MKERRKFVRRPLAVSLELIAPNNRKTIARGFVTNISEGGLALETPKNLPIGEKYAMRFSLPNEWEFDLKGEILYAREGVLTRAYGARFYEVSPAAADRLRDFLFVNVTQ